MPAQVIAAVLCSPKRSAETRWLLGAVAGSFAAQCCSRGLVSLVPVCGDWLQSRSAVRRVGCTDAGQRRSRRLLEKQLSGPAYAGPRCSTDAVFAFFLFHGLSSARRLAHPTQLPALLTTLQLVGLRRGLASFFIGVAKLIPEACHWKAVNAFLKFR